MLQQKHVLPPDSKANIKNRLRETFTAAFRRFIALSGRPISRCLVLEVAVLLPTCQNVPLVGGDLKSYLTVSTVTFIRVNRSFCRRKSASF